MSHERIDQRSLALHQRVAERLLRDPGLVMLALRTLERWSSRPDASAASIRTAEEWQHLLRRLTVQEVAALLTEDSEEARRLRQNSPFAGVLSPAEVWNIKRQFAHAAL